MKRSVIMTAVLLIALNFDFFNLKAQSPDMMSYQAVIRDATGALVRNKRINMVISIIHGTPDGNVVFKERHYTNTNENGLVSIIIGVWPPGYADAELKASAPDDDQVTRLEGMFSLIRWDKGPFFIKVEVDPTGGTDYTVTGTSQLLSVPYAMYAKKAASAKFIDGLNHRDAVYIDGKVGIGIFRPRTKLHVLGSILVEHGYRYILRNDTLDTQFFSRDNDVYFKCWSGGSFNFYNDTVPNSALPRMIISSDGKVGIGTTVPEGQLHIKSKGKNSLVIESYFGNDPDRPGIQFKNNTSHYISGDDMSDEYFGFYSGWSSARKFDAKLRVFGKADKSWGTYLEMTHDGTNGTIRTDAGDIKIQPEGNIDVASKRVMNVASPVDDKDAVNKSYVDIILNILKSNNIVIADFEADNTVVKKGIPVTFKDKSTIDPDEWYWEFGDRDISKEQNPVHIYKNSGVYTVKLTVMNGNFKSVEKKSDYITVTDEAPTVTDRDGNVYNTVWIGNQLWMNENLKVTHYPDGGGIPYIEDQGGWSGLDAATNYSHAYTYYNYDENSPYGVLYTYAAAIAYNWERDNNVHPTQGICPDGWHLPSESEWQKLIDFISNDGHKDEEAIVLKSTTGWSNNGTNDYGFKALPGGTCSLGTFMGGGSHAYWWSSTEDENARVFYQHIVNDSTKVLTGFTRKDLVMSVRCVKD